MSLDLREWGRVGSSKSVPAPSPLPPGPDTIAGLLAWFDPAEAYVTKSGSPAVVSQFVSRDASAYVLAPSSTGPIWTATGIWSEPALYFPNANETLIGTIALANTLATTTFTAYSVATFITSGSQKALWCVGSDVNNSGVRGYQRSPNNTPAFRTENTASAATEITSIDVGTNPFYLGYFYTPATGVSFRINGSAVAGGASNRTPRVCTVFSLGAQYRNAVISLNMKGYIGDTIFYDHILTAGEITTLETWIRAKYVGI